MGTVYSKATKGKYTEPYMKEHRTLHEITNRRRMEGYHKSVRRKEGEQHYEPTRYIP